MSVVRYLLVAVVFVAVGIGVLVYLAMTKPEPKGKLETDVGRSVRVFKAEKTSHRLRISAYGTSRASEVWTAIAEVPGRAVKINPRFEPGELLSEKTTLIWIDPTDYDLAVVRLEAEVRAQKERLRELKQNEANLKKIVELLERQLKLASNEYERQRELFDRNVGSRSAMETAENAYVTGLTAVQESRNNLALIPIQQDLAQASLDVAKTQLKQAQQDRSECEIQLPMAARCVSKSIEENQYATLGERLGTFLSLDMTEVVAMVEARKMGSLFPSGIEGTLNISDLTEGRSLLDLIKVPVEVRWGLGDLRAVWYGRVARIGSSLDPSTRTTPVIIEVPHPYEDVKPGVRPPLVPDVFCEVTFFGATVRDVFLIPCDALRDDRVYLVRNGKLHIQPVTVISRETDIAVISKGLEQGDLVILTDLFPASEGMPLRGEIVKNPVKVPEVVDFPKDLFDPIEKPDRERTSLPGDTPEDRAKKDPDRGNTLSPKPKTAVQDAGEGEG